MDAAGVAAIDISGASTVAAVWDTSAVYAHGAMRIGITTVLTGLTAGSTTFKMQYRQAATSCTFSNREISVEPVD
jgi:hypothetical protein